MTFTGSTAKVTLVDTTTSLSDMIDGLTNLPHDPPSLFIDLEGVNLSRHGYLSILQLYNVPKGEIYLVDVHVLGAQTFSTPASSGCTLQQILETQTIPKVLFDVRNDSDALYSHFGIRLAGIHDLQLMELATRNFSRKIITGLAKCIEKDAPLSLHQRAGMMQVKMNGLRLFAPEKGGSYEVFNQRPIPRDIILYCAQDVQILPQLYAHYSRKMTPAWKEKMLSASRDRVTLSQSATFNGKGRHMALAPLGWQ